MRFAIIGLGRFGTRLARNLAMAGEEVMAIDCDQQIVDEISDKVTMSVSLDSTDEQAFRGIDIGSVDVAVVVIGENFEAEVLTTVVLKQLGVGRVIARAGSAMREKVLRSVGADDVVNPEDESADRWAGRLLSPQFIDRLELDEGYSIVEMKVPDVWVRKTLIELKLREKTGVHVVAMKLQDGSALSLGGGRARIRLPVPDQQLQADDVLLLMGKNSDLEKLPSGV